MTEVDIKLAIRTEHFHRKCYDEIYVQFQQPTAQDQKTLATYECLYQRCPNFRQICYDEFLILSAIENINAGRLTVTERENLQVLKTINFDRYSVVKRQ